jgi:hypothetical protein
MTRIPALNQARETLRLFLRSDFSSSLNSSAPCQFETKAAHRTERQRGPDEVKPGVENWQGAGAKGTNSSLLACLG